MRKLLNFLGILVFAALLFGLVTTDGTQSVGAFFPGPRESPHYRDGVFVNDGEVTAEVKDPIGLAKLWFTNKAETVPLHPLPLYAHTLDDLARPPESGLRVTWFGHSSTLIELDGARILTDPQWSERCSPSMSVGPKRFHPPVIPLEKIGHLDAVLISHDHYDHLDMASIKALATTGVRFLVALGVGSHLRKWGIPENQILEHDWWQETRVTESVKAVSSQAQHFSGRFLFRNNTLWTSWSILGPNHRVFFSGDTGLGPHLEEIAKRFGPFDLSMLEIGQFHPSWGTIHLGPEGALRAHHMLGAKHLMPIHWATFELGMHAWNEPPETLVTSAGDVDVVTPMLGEPVEPTKPAERARWWRAPAP